MNLPEGAWLQGGKYRIKRYINSGGFGCTYEAKHTMLEKRVAIKEFFVKDFCNRDEATARVTVATLSKLTLVEKLKRKFIDEAKALARMQHPGIVNVSDVFEENGTAYYVMDYIDGCSLHDVLRHAGQLNETCALGYIRQVAEALSYVHQQNRLHLDLKPGNVMIDRKGKAVLIDFGASKQYDEQGGENTSTVQGYTKGFAPPEQMTNDVVKFMPATDIYALGAMLYKMLTGTTPPSATLRISGEPLEALPASVCAGSVRAIEESMRLNKHHRPQTVEAFLALLDGSAEEAVDVVVTPEEDENTVPLGEQKPKPKPVNNTSYLGMLLRKPIDAIEACIAAAYVDRPVGLWALVPVALLLVSCFVDIYGYWIVNLPEHSWHEYPFFLSMLFTSAYIVSGTFAFAKMGKSRNKLSSICLYVWACLMLFVYIDGTFDVTVHWWEIPSDILVDALYYISCSLNITNIIAQVSLIAFLVLRFKKTSTYKLPLMVGIAGVVVRLVNILTCCYDYGILCYGSIPQGGWHPLPHLIIYFFHALLMATSFVLMFFASRKLEKKRVGQC